MSRTCGPRAKLIASEVAGRYGLSLVDMQSQTHARRVAWPRQHVMSELSVAGYGVYQIGFFLNRDHTTVLYGIDRHRERMAWAEVMARAGACLAVDAARQRFVHAFEASADMLRRAA